MTRLMGPGACDGARHVYNYTFMLISVNLLLFRVSLIMINTDKTERAMGKIAKCSWNLKQKKLNNLIHFRV